MSGTTLDDADPAVAYSGNWAAYSGLSTTYRGTAHESSSLNDRATFSFQGIGVLVDSGQQGIGWRARSSYAIDGGSPTVYSNDSYQSTTEAYRSPTLANGQHTLTVINLDNRLSLYLDSFLVLTPDDAVSTPSPNNPTSTLTSATVSTSVSPNPSITNSGTTTTTGASSSTSNSAVLANPTQSSTLSRPDTSPTSIPSSTSKHTDPGQILLIVGPIFGAILICGIAILYILLRRRRKRNEPDSMFTPATFNNPMRFHPSMWENGQKPSTFVQDPGEPPPYVQDSQSSSPSFTPIRQPAKFSVR